MDTRPFGSTGEQMPNLSLGCQQLVDENGCSEEQAMAILSRALDRGIRYFDTAWAYSLGQSEQRVGQVAKHRRDEMWIATKVRDTSQAGARRQLEESLNRLQTGFVDEWRLHDICDQARLDAMMGPGGALEAAICAREEGLVRLISISGHSNPRVQLEGSAPVPVRFGSGCRICARPLYSQLR
jgi:aryl-alcohol dehydrogenase-like predicted oxidoreductase